MLVSCPEFSQLCIVCGNGFMEMIRAVSELSLEMANAYGVDVQKEGFETMPGVPIEEIEVRMQLNRLGHRK
jgi:hypothetical protein